MTALSASAADTLPRIQDLKFPTLREVKIPEVTTFRLPNGMRVYMLENHELPLVSGTALVRTGNLFDPPDKVGLAGITGSVLRTGGTKAHTGDQLDNTLESMAASVEAGIGESSGSVSFSALKENTDQVLAIFKEVLTTPEFRQDRLDLAKTQTKSGISRRNDDADSVSDREFESIVYGRNNPYGWEMQYEHIDNIKREDLQAFYNRYFFPDNIMLAISGDFNTADMRQKLEKLFADWTIKGQAVPPFPQVQRQANAAGVYEGTKTDVTQTFFNMGHLGGVFRDKDYPALSVMSDILSGDFSGRLFVNVRTRKGLAYSIGGGWHASYDHPGVLRLGGSTKSQSTVDAIKAVREEVDKIRAAEVTDQELQTAKSAVLNSFVFNFDQPRKVLTRYVTYEYFGYPKDFIFQYQKGVEATTRADVLRVAKEYIKPDQFVIVAVGNPKEFGTPLSALGTVNELDLTIPEPGAGKTSQADPAAQAKGKALFAKAQEALGGADKIRAVKDVSMEGTLTISQGGGNIKVQQTNEFVLPDNIRVIQTLPFGKITSVWNGKEGWMVTPQGTVPMQPPVIKQVQGSIFRNPALLYRADTNPDVTITAVSDNTIQVRNKAGESVTIQFDTATGLPARQTYHSVGQQGPVDVTEIYSDWRSVDGGLKAPFHITIEQAGQKFADMELASFKLNSGLKAEEVGKKP